MAPSGTFDYVAIVPDNLELSASPWTARLQEPLEHPDDPELGCRLVGSSPNLQITDAGPTPEPSESVSRSRFTLTASSREHASVSAASFYVDRRLASLLKPRDVLYMSRTFCGGLGLSVIREGELLAAAGAITAVPLGKSVQARVPGDLVKEAEAVFKKRDETFEFPEFPIEITIGGDKCIKYYAARRMGQYEVWIKHGFRLGVPGQDECVAIVRAGVNISAARASALLLGPIEIVDWQGLQLGVR